MVGRRDVVLGSLALAGCAGTGGAREAESPSASKGAPHEPMWGVQSGEVSASSAVVWSRADRASVMEVEWSTSPSFANARAVAPVDVSPARDLTAVTRLDGLPSDSRIHYRARFVGDDRRRSPWTAGTLKTPPASDDARSRDVVFAWSGDINGQGWGIDDARGGMPAYRALADRAPDFFVCVGDAIYADNPIPKELPLEGGGTWKNLVTDAKSHVAQTLDDYRGAFLYPRHSKEVRAFSAQVPVFHIWDDHEVRNNWWPGQIIPDDRYTERRTEILMAHARRAMNEHTPVLPGTKTYRSFRWGPLLEVFLLDGRSFRTPNEPAPDIESFLGATQLAWLEDSLAASRAVWKVIACDMPIGLVVSEPGVLVKGLAYDGFANDDGPPRGRELELVRLFAAMKRRGVKNVVWLTADVHYAAAHRYDPVRAQAGAKEMDPFWEFVAGPLHATAFPRKPLDDTFGPEVVYASTDHRTIGTPADPRTQSFGVIRIDGATKTMTVTLAGGHGGDLHVTVLRPVG
ncbi:MAG: alkaline phosphatase D family protein [Deltaproteobacteria bacterium]|nr:alkaline phosphatase D family protein [Deltaproteobacteria bacterium]